MIRHATPATGVQRGSPTNHVTSNCVLVHLTPEETAKLNAVLDYIDELNALDISTVSCHSDIQ
ncbi:hypothetical protein [Escherichia coli]|uniref:hypothetical protein n=1 Tax=Escherichia coli TaxID=562 RepID=UPI004068BD92